MNILSIWDKLLIKIIEKTSSLLIIDHNIDIDVELELTNTLKELGFTETINGWSKGFVSVLLKKDGVFIYHNINGHRSVKLTRCENPLLTIRSWVNYFSRI